MKIMRVGVLVLSAELLISGCDQGQERFIETSITLDKARLHGDARRQAMVDNAMLQDMSLGDILFVPHSTELNSLGEQRLQRYADLLRPHGGTLYLEATSTDEQFNQARIQSITNFLASAGIAEDRIATEVGLRAGRGIAAVEAIQVKEQAFAPEQRGLTDLMEVSGGEFGTGG